MSAPAGPDEPPGAGENPRDGLLPLLLEICEDFLAQASPATRNEVDLLLRARNITGGPGWLIDMLALTRLHLQDPARQDLRHGS